MLLYNVSGSMPRNSSGQIDIVSRLQRRRVVTHTRVSRSTKVAVLGFLWEFPKCIRHASRQIQQPRAMRIDYEIASSLFSGPLWGRAHHPWGLVGSMCTILVMTSLFASSPGGVRLTSCCIHSLVRNNWPLSDFLLLWRCLIPTYTSGVVLYTAPAGPPSKPGAFPSRPSSRTAHHHHHHFLLLLLLLRHTGRPRRRASGSPPGLLRVSSRGHGLASGRPVFPPSSPWLALRSAFARPHLVRHASNN